MNKKIRLKMVGLDGNAFSILAAFRKQAQKEGWTSGEIDYVLKEARSKDYSYLIGTIANYCKNPG